MARRAPAGAHVRGLTGVAVDIRSAGRRFAPLRSPRPPRCNGLFWIEEPGAAGRFQADGEAVGFDGDAFLNMVVSWRTDLALDELMAALGEIEVLCGRSRNDMRFV